MHGSGQTFSLCMHLVLHLHLRKCPLVSSGLWEVSVILRVACVYYKYRGTYYKGVTMSLWLFFVDGR